MGRKTAGLAALKLGIRWLHMFVAAFRYLTLAPDLNGIQQVSAPVQR